MKTIILDIETIPDEPALARVGIESDGDFPPWPLHEIACVSILSVEQTRYRNFKFEVGSFSRAELSERAIIGATEQVLDQASEVVTFNGKGFDLPVLMARAAVATEHAPTIVALRGTQRPGVHVDLLDEVVGYRGAPRIKLAHLCAAFNIPVKLEAAGEDVAALARAGQWGTITRYCETDVVATWLAMKMWRSCEDPDQGPACWAALADWIRSDQPRLHHLLPYASPPAFPGGGSALSDADIIF
jgi:predicted PolB exonuclease-like 3'-5' exonuclease